MPEWAAAGQAPGKIVEWDVFFLLQFSALLTTIIEQPLKHGGCSGALPISMATRVPRPGGDPAADRRLKNPMCALTYKANVDPRTIRASLDTPALRPYLTGGVGADDNGAGTAVILPMRSGLVAVMLVNMPLLLGGLVDDIAQRAARADWRRESDTWRSHVMVAAFGNNKSLRAQRAAAEDVIRVALALAWSSGAAAVEWSAAELFYSAQEFIILCEKTLLSADVLFRTTWYQGEGPRGMAVGARTKGMSLFGPPEIDYPPSGEDGPEIFNRLLNLATYVLMSGVVPKARRHSGCRYERASPRPPHLGRLGCIDAGGDTGGALIR
jgi:hypothetical protein